MSQSQNSALRELDVKVAEQVMGEVMAHSPCGDGLTRSSVEYGPTLAACDAAIRESYKTHVANGMRLWPAEYCGPEYSADIAAAFQVVEAMRGKKFSFRCDDNLTALPWYVGFRNDDPSPIAGKDFEAEAPTLPEAICLAALRAIEASGVRPSETREDRR